MVYQPAVRSPARLSPALPLGNIIRRHFLFMNAVQFGNSVLGESSPWRSELIAHAMGCYRQLSSVRFSWAPELDGERPRQALSVGARAGGRVEAVETRACPARWRTNLSIDSETKGRSIRAARGARSGSSPDLGLAPERPYPLGARDGDSGNHPADRERRVRRRFPAGSPSRAGDPQRPCAFEVMAGHITGDFGAYESRRRGR